jgi:hypothetical protein
MITEKTDLMPEVSPSWTASHWTEGRGESVRRDVIRTSWLNPRITRLQAGARHLPTISPSVLRNLRPTIRE